MQYCRGTLTKNIITTPSIFLLLVVLATFSGFQLLPVRIRYPLSDCIDVNLAESNSLYTIQQKPTLGRLSNKNSILCGLQNGVVPADFLTVELKIRVSYSKVNHLYLSRLSDRVKLFVDLTDFDSVPTSNIFILCVNLTGNKSVLTKLFS